MLLLYQLGSMNPLQYLQKYMTGSNDLYTEEDTINDQ